VIYFVALFVLVGVGVIAAALTLLHRKDRITMADFTALQASVAKNTTEVGSVLTILAGLSAQVKATQPTQAAIDALAAQIDQTSAAMTAAAVANTPASASPVGPASPPVAVS
jgi:hypothetical protein